MGLQGRATSMKKRANLSQVHHFCNCLFPPRAKLDLKVSAHNHFEAPAGSHIAPSIEKFAQVACLRTSRSPLELRILFFASFSSTVGDHSEVAPRAVYANIASTNLVICSCNTHVATTKLGSVPHCVLKPPCVNPPPLIGVLPHFGRTPVLYRR